MQDFSTVTLNNSIEMPVLGLGVYQSRAEETPRAVAHALRSGYRLIDTAAAYLNEQAVGQGIRESGVARDEVFVTTKLWVGQYGKAEALHGFESSLKRLGLEYLDLYLLHWPLPMEFDKTVASYRVAEELLQQGRVRAIGVCNFQPKHLDRLMQHASITPAVNQIELNPFFNQKALREANAARGIVTECWSPIGGTYRRKPESAPGGIATPMEHPVIVAIAERHGKQPVQVVLRWHVQHGLVAIPKSTNPERIASNAQVFDFELSVQDMKAIDALGSDERSGPDPEQFSASHYSVDVDEQPGR